jgi:hypothetical protein
MKKILFTFLTLGAALTARTQNVGLSFSYFIPTNGGFSTPISPFSIRGVGFKFSNHFAFQTGASLYRMAGLSIKDTPISTNQSLTGPNFTVFVPAELVLRFEGKRLSLDIKGGGFFFYGFDQQLNVGNIDKAIRNLEKWTVANSDFSFKNNPGIGIQGGIELTMNVTSQLGISIETNYLRGQSALPLTGTYTGGTSTLETKSIDYKDAKVDFTGLEFSIGLIFNTASTSPEPKRKRR